MPTQAWLKQAFAHGYDSGDVARPAPDPVRAGEERAIGGSYYDVFQRAIVPFLAPDSAVLELGPGRGSWTRAMLGIVARGCVHTVDFLDVAPWLRPERYGGRLVCHRSSDNSFDAVPDAAFDFFFSFGVLCHNNGGHVAEILANSRPKMKPGGVAVHQYGDWSKLDAEGWERSGMPAAFKDLPDDQILVAAQLGGRHDASGGAGRMGGGDARPAPAAPRRGHRASVRLVVWRNRGGCAPAAGATSEYFAIFR